MLGALADDQVKELVEGYRRDGYLVIRDAFEPYEVAAWAAECERLAADKQMVHPNNMRTPFRMGATVNPERIDPVIDVSPVFKSLANDRRVTNVVREIFGGTEPCIWKDKIIYKDPGVAGYGMHQDAAWWQGLDVPLNEMLSVMIAIDGADEANGCLEVFSGYQHGFLTTPGELRCLNDQEKAKVDSARGQKVETQAGDVIIFHALTPHQSAKNTSNRGRRQFYLTYNNGQFGDHYQRQQTHYRTYTMRDLKPEDRESKYWK